MITCEKQHQAPKHTPQRSQTMPVLLYLSVLFFTVLINTTLSQSVFAESAAAQQNTPKALQLSSVTAGQLFPKPFTTFYDPGAQNPTISDIVQMPDQQWAALSTRTASIVLHPRHEVWYRIPIHNNLSEDQVLYLRDNSPVTDDVSSYLCLRENDVRSCTKNTDLTHNKNIQQIDLAAGQSATLIIKSKGFHSFIYTLSIQTPTAFSAQQYKTRIWFGILNGILSGLGIYALLIAVYTKQKSYLFYYIFTFFLVATFFFHQDFFRIFSGIAPKTLLTNFSIILPLFDSASLACFLAYFTFNETPPTRVKTTLKIYLAALCYVAIAFTLNAPTVFLFPIYGMATLAVFIYFFYLYLTHNKISTTNKLLLLFGVALPFYNFSSTMLAAIGLVNAPNSFLLTSQSLETLSLFLLSVVTLLSIKQLQLENIEHARAASQANITSDAHNQLLSHLNHELRTPLNGILGAAEILMHKSHLPKDRRVFSMIYHTALPLKYLIEDIVNIKSITKNQSALQNTRLDLHSLLQECVDIFLLTAHDKKIRLYFQIDNNVTSDITTDINRLRQILINLLGNACKFTSDGIVGLHVSQESTPAANQHLYCFEVIDSGIGVKEEDEKKLFTFFESMNPEVNPKGTGVGLSVVRELSQMMGGHCGYRKNPSGGSTFWFSIKVTTHHNTTRKTHRAFDGLNLLLADKDTYLVNSIYEKISDAVNTLITTNTEQQIIDALRETTPNENNHGTTVIDAALIYSELANEKTINAILTTGIPLFVYKDYDEITSSEEIMGNEKGYEVILRKPSVETFSLNIAEAILRKNSIIHKVSPKVDRPHKSVLIVDDIPTNQLIIEEIITSIGLKPITSCNGKQAFEAFIQHHKDGSAFKVIIMDCEMPIMDGFESTEMIREYEKSHGLKPALIIALSAHAEQEYRLRSKQSGMDIYLTKPVQTATLIQHIENQYRSLA